MNISVLKKLLTKYIGGHLTLLGEISDDPSMQRAVRSYLPVVDCEPASPTAVALKVIANNLVKHIGEGRGAQAGKMKALTRRLSSLAPSPPL